uniref:Odorant receptor n=1 Tax=Eogystia hippophaecolus TaxID=1206364 RepID=A0A1B3P5T4_EOGHI|nr:odorant receptor [Eogystia hippophaecolus]
MRQMYILLNLSVILFVASECVDIIWFVKSNITLLLHNLKITSLETVSVCKLSTFLVWNKIIIYVTESDVMQRKTDDTFKKTIIKKFT